MKQKIEIEVDVPSGWDVTGYRAVEFGETYIGWPGVAVKWGHSYPSIAEVFILRRREPVRESRWGILRNDFYDLGYDTFEKAKTAALAGGYLVTRFDAIGGKLVRVELEEVSDG